MKSWSLDSKCNVITRDVGLPDVKFALYRMLPDSVYQISGKLKD